MPPVHLTLIGKPGCHLCDDARGVVASVLEELRGEPGAPDVALEERSILDDADLHELYVDDIPVVLINGKVHNHWRIDPVRLSTELRKLR